MQYSIENEILRLTVDTHGAKLYTFRFRNRRKGYSLDGRELYEGICCKCCE